MAKKSGGHIYSVSKLTREIKTLLEDAFPIVWVTGEISNHAQPASGHSYFTLKDSNAVISAVMFKNQKRNLKFFLENGIKISGLARISLYEPRGNYQLVFEHIEPAGAGSIQLAFEQLKNKLQQKGYFNEFAKKPIPFLPEKVCVITSATGAAVRDIVQVSSRRFPNCRIDIIPVKVQGDESILEICDAFALAEEHCKTDVIILARGGGSLEDLQPFNSEQVAETLFDCRIPVVTGIGHETDVTIADFVADLRAPTPSAAAELVFPDKTRLAEKVVTVSSQLKSKLTSKLTMLRDKGQALTARLKTPEMLIYNSRLRIEDFSGRLTHAFLQQITTKQHKTKLLTQTILTHSPGLDIDTRRSELTLNHNRLNQSFKHYIFQIKNRLNQSLLKLETLNPKAILRRGYSITRSVPEQHILKDTNEIAKDDLVEIIFSKGRLTAKVKKKYG